MKDSRPFGSGLFGQAPGAGLSNLLNAYIWPNGRPAAPGMPGGDLGALPSLPHPLDLTQPAGSPLAGVAPMLMLLPTGARTANRTAAADVPPGAAPMSGPPAPSSAPVNAANPPPPDAGPQISPTYIQAMHNRLMQQGPAPISAAEVEKLHQIPLINGRTAPGGDYTIIDGRHFKPDATFAPEMARALTAAIQEMNASGITPQITDGFRTAAQQQQLYADQGDLPAASVSWHQTGNAVDFNSKIGKDWRNIVAIMRKHGFEWGAGYKPKSDPVHFRFLAAGQRITPDMLGAVGGN